ncbi:hypothetical protein E4Z66_03305 [Aliishimia ponticola]|uniref:Uncharacterized protein n=1 Tax=Aliishimia ponticola TaxID=2499833 RepID=A0A4S4NQX2_9RHOB|nr:hypothetical protein [Aliishimia ponticola]THH38610.1 hypothetical protein E4Z66_03305 [Aliishimia ponticola]
MSPQHKLLVDRLKNLLVLDARQGKPIDWTRSSMRVAGYPERVVNAAIEEYVEEYGGFGSQAR